jgi:anti-sigma regulatory factor (Ser/Thr protein kinase)
MHRQADSGGHQAMMYSAPAEFADWAVAFLGRGVDADAKVLAVAGPKHARLLQTRLGSGSGSVEFIDPESWYTTPARTMATFDLMAQDHADLGRAVHILGEPPWLDRSPFEQLGWHRFESLLNLTFRDRDVTMGCAYDARTIDPETAGMVHRTHPVIASGTDHESSPGFREPVDFFAEYGASPLEPPVGPVVSTDFDIGLLAAARQFVNEQAGRLQLPTAGLPQLVVAVSEITTNAVQHGGGGGQLSMWRSTDHVVVEVRDHGTQPPDPLAGYLRPDITNEPEGGFGLWMARQLCDIVELRGGPGWVVRMYAALAEPTD